LRFLFPAQKAESTPWCKQTSSAKRQQSPFQAGDHITTQRRHKRKTDWTTQYGYK
jgi:hypothetical protein